MSLTFFRPLSAVLCTVLLLMFNPLTAVMSWSADKPKYVDKQTKALRAKVYEKLAEAQEKQEAGEYDDALKILNNLKQRTGRSALQTHELVQLYNFYAYVYLAQEKYPQAIKSFEKVLQQPELYIGTAAATQFTLAQLYFSNEQVDKAVGVLEEWFTIAEKPSPDAYVLLSQGYLHQSKIDEALVPLLKAFELAKSKGKAAKENWYALLQYIYAEKKDYKKQVKALEMLVNQWPKKTYWLSLFGVYAELNDDKKRLYALEAAYMQGMLDRGSYIISLAQMLAAEDIPYRAAKVMEKGLADGLVEKNAKNLERTGEYWRRAQELEKALPRLSEAAKLAEDGEPGIRLAYLYMNNYNYEYAAKQVKAALRKGGVKRPLEARFLLGQALFHALQYNDARKNFNDVIAQTRHKKDSERMFKLATQWLAYMESEIKRRKEIETYLKA